MQFRINVIFSLLKNSVDGTWWIEQLSKLFMGEWRSQLFGVIFLKHILDYVLRFGNKNLYFRCFFLKKKKVLERIY